MTYPAEYPPVVNPENWNTVVAQLKGFTPSGTFVSPYSFVVHTNVVGGVTYYYASNAFQTVYGGDNWAVISPTVNGTDAVAVIQAAINASTAAGGGIIFVKRGSYPVVNTNVTVPSKVLLVGEGKGTVFLLTGTGVFVSYAATDVMYRDIYIDASVGNPSAASASISLMNVTDVKVQGVHVLGNKAFGIYVSATVGETTERVIIEDCYLTGLGNHDVIGGGSTGTTKDLTIRNNTVMQDASLGDHYPVAIDIVKATKVTIDNNIIYGNIVLGYELYPHMETSITDNKVHPAAGASYCEINVVQATGGMTPFEEITISGNIIKDGRIIAQGISTSWSLRTTISNNQIVAKGEIASDYGIWLIHMQECLVSGNIINAGTTSIYIDTSAYINILGNTILNSTVGIGQNVTTQIQISENMFYLVTTPVSGTDATSKVRNNFGYITENSGTGSIANTTTSDVITHGCSYTPTAKDITITLTENPTNTPGAIWVDTITATEFTVNCENDPGASNLDFSWSVRKV